MEPQRLRSFEAVIGVRFHDLELLKLSLIHSSYINEHPLEAPISNERLEYLGDALLGMLNLLAFDLKLFFVAVSVTLSYLFH